MPRLAAAAPVRRRKAPAAAPRRVAVRKAAPMRKVYVKKAPTRNSKSSGLGGSLGSAIGTALGAALGGPAGAGVGGMIGNAGGSFISKMLGHGDYAVTNASQLKENNLVLANAAQMPQFGTGKVACKFVNREFLGDVYSSSTPGAFKINDYPINPGLNSTFPWLSGVVGAKFQQYRINGMSFEYRSMSGDALNSTNTALGSVIMSTDYDSADATFASKQEMENTEYGVSCKPSVNMMHGIECARFQTPVSELYIRAYDVPANKDIRLYDMGRFSIATVGCQAANVNLGELWVSYDIDCFKAIEQPPNYLTPFAQYTLNNVDSTHSLGTSQTEVKDQIGLTFDYIAGVASIILPYGLEAGTKFMLYYGVYGTAVAGMVGVSYPVTTGGVNAIGSVTGTPYPDSPATCDFRSYSGVFLYDGTATPANPPKIAIPGGVMPSAITVSTVSISFVSSYYPSDGM